MIFFSPKPNLHLEIPEAEYANGGIFDGACAVGTSMSPDGESFILVVSLLCYDGRPSHSWDCNQRCRDEMLIYVPRQGDHDGCGR